MYNYKDICNIKCFRSLTYENYKDFLDNEYDFQLYVYITLRLKGYEIYIDRDIRNLVSNKYMRFLASNLTCMNKYSLKSLSNSEIASGRPDFIINVNSFYDDTVRKKSSFCPYIAVECKFLRETELKPIFQIKEQVESFKNSVFECGDVIFKNPSLYITTPLSFIVRVELLTQWKCFGNNEPFYLTSNVLRMNEAVIHCLYGFLEVGVFGRVSGISDKENKYGVYDLSRRFVLNYKYSFK